MSLPVVVLLIVFGFLAFTVLMALIAEIVKMRIGQPRATGGMSNEESRDFQEIYRGFESMGKRIEALETILMDQVKKG